MKKITLLILCLIAFNSFVFTCDEKKQNNFSPSENQELTTPAEKSECCICMDEDRPQEDLYQACHGHEMHRFHLDCIFTWLKKKKTCPICRREIQETVIKDIEGKAPSVILKRFSTILKRFITALEKNDEGDLKKILEIINDDFGKHVLDLLPKTENFDVTDILDSTLDSTLDPTLVSSTLNKIFLVVLHVSELASLQLLNNENFYSKIRDETYNRAFLISAEKGHKEIIDLFIDLSSDEDEDFYGTISEESLNEAILVSIKQGYKEIVECLFENQVELNFIPKYDAVFYLNLAVENGHLEIVEFLLDEDEYASFQFSSGGIKNAFKTSISHGYNEIACLLLKREDTREFILNDVNEMLKEAVEDSCEDTVKFLLENTSIAFNVFCFVLKNISCEKIAQLLNTYYSFDSILEWAINNELEENVNFLLNHKYIKQIITPRAIWNCLVHTINKKKTKIRDLLINNYDMDSVLIWAAGEGLKDIVEYLVEDKTIDFKINADEALKKSSGDGNEKALQLLLENNKIKENISISAFYSALQVSFNNEKILNLLAGYFSIGKFLVWAVEQDSEENVNFLLKHENIKKHITAEYFYDALKHATTNYYGKFTTNLINNCDKESLFKIAAEKEDSEVIDRLVALVSPEFIWEFIKGAETETIKKSLLCESRVLAKILTWAEQEKSEELVDEIWTEKEKYEEGREENDIDLIVFDSPLSPGINDIFLDFTSTPDSEELDASNRDFEAKPDQNIFRN